MAGDDSLRADEQVWFTGNLFFFFRQLNRILGWAELSPETKKEDGGASKPMCDATQMGNTIIFFYL